MTYLKPLQTFEIKSCESNKIAKAQSQTYVDTISKYANTTGTSYKVSAQVTSPERSKLVVIPWLIALQQPLF